MPFIITGRGAGLGSENQDVCFHMLSLKHLLDTQAETVKEVIGYMNLEFWEEVGVGEINS